MPVTKERKNAAHSLPEACQRGERRGVGQTQQRGVYGV
jgi:hypothetical protein